MLKYMLAFAALALPLAGCATAPALDTNSTTRTLVLERFFEGRTYAQGSFVNALTGAERKVKVVLIGHWNGRVLKLFEDFTYADGERAQKTWYLTKTGPTTYTGTREDVIGTAEGRQDGPLVRLAYDANLMSGGSQIAVRFDDVLELQPDGSVLNKAVISKLGMRIGDVTLRIARRR